MKTLNYSYHFFYLEIALKDPTDLSIYAYESVSHIPTRKLIELFNIDLNKDPFITEGYFLKLESYLKHNKYISANMPRLLDFKFRACGKPRALSATLFDTFSNPN